MGHMQAMDLASTDLVDRSMALMMHLRSNHYPPVPLEMVPVCEAAIDAANDGRFGAEISLPDGVEWRGQDHVPAHRVIEDFHLEAWIEGVTW